MLYLVRHADAGNKHVWTGVDSQRPLSDAGWRQARWLAGQLDSRPLTAIVSSPALRCVQTVEPLARRRGLQVRTDPRLDVDGHAGQATRLLLDVAGTPTLWCSHGELIGEVLSRLRACGAPIDGAAEWVKGSVWRLEVLDGTVVGATYQPPAD